MRSLVPVIAIVSMFAGYSASAQDTDVRSAFDKYTKLMAGCDLEAVKAMTTSDWVMVGGPRTGGDISVEDRNTAYVKSDPDCKPGEPARVSELRVRTYGADTAVLVGRAHLPRSLGVQQFTSVWVRQGGVWREASQHNSWIDSWKK